MSPASHAPLCTRQGAYAFNQPLTFNTSSVTYMQNMFQVRLPIRPLASWPACRPLIYALPLDSRQDADAFNQPLSFDTSSVTTMDYMFQVRSAPAHATHPPVGLTLHVT